MNARVLFLLFALVSTAGCSALTPITTLLDLTEAHEAVQKDKEQPTEIQTSLTKKNGKVVAISDSPKSVIGDPIINPEMKPSFDPEKAVSSVPTWLYVLVGLSGLLFFINMVRHHYNKKKEVNYDSSGTDNDGWRSPDGRSVQVHGQRSEKQAEADGNDDGGPSATGGHQERRQRVSIQVGRRSGE